MTDHNSHPVYSVGAEADAKAPMEVQGAIDRLTKALNAAHPNHKTMFVFVDDLRAALADWTEVPEDMPLELLKSINIDNQVLAYENGRYYNAWFTFEPSEGGWFWTDDADSEPDPSHYRPLYAAPASRRSALIGGDAQEGADGTDHGYKSTFYPGNVPTGGDE